MLTGPSMLLVTIAVLFFSLAAGQTCQTLLQIGTSSKQFSQCMNLPSQGASLAWTYFPLNNTMDMAFSGVATSTSGWVGWGYNPQSPAMIGSTALIAFTNSSGPFLEQYSLVAATKGGTPLKPSTSSTDLKVLNKSVSFQGTKVAFTALIQFTSSTSGMINHVWNRGPGINNGNEPQAHTDITSVAGTVNLLQGTSSTAKVPYLHRKNTHGILNGISWGILLPIGAMSARYLRPFQWADPAWFYIHATCQTAGYVLGVIGWAYGLNLGALSDGVVQTTHRNIGITIFVFGTLQVLAIFFRPNKTHDLRMYWNVYHHSVGYTTIVLALVNIFKGFDILQPAKGWKRAYIGIIVALAVLSLVFEVLTWIAYFSRKRAAKLEKPNNQQRWEDNPYGAQNRV